MEFVLAMAAGLSKKKLAEMAKEAAEAYLQYPTEKNWHDLANITLLIQMHEQTGGTYAGAVELDKKLKQKESQDKLFEPNQN